MPATVIVAEAPGPNAVKAEIEEPAIPVAEPSSVELPAPLCRGCEGSGSRRPLLPSLPCRLRRCRRTPWMRTRTRTKTSPAGKNDADGKRRSSPWSAPRSRSFPGPTLFPKRPASSRRPSPRLLRLRPLLRRGLRPSPLKTKRPRKNARRTSGVVEFFQDLTDEEERRRASLQAKKKKTTDVGDRTGGRGKPKRRRDFHDEELLAARSQASQLVKAVKRKIRVEEGHPRVGYGQTDGRQGARGHQGAHGGWESWPPSTKPLIWRPPPWLRRNSAMRWRRWASPKRTICCPRPRTSPRP